MKWEKRRQAGGGRVGGGLVGRPEVYIGTGASRGQTHREYPILQFELWEQARPVAGIALILLALTELFASQATITTIKTAITFVEHQIDHGSNCRDTLDQVRGCL